MFNSLIYTIMRHPIAAAISCLLFIASSVHAQLKAGDVAIIAVNTDDPDIFAWAALNDIPAHTTINFTDSSVSNDCFRWSEHLGPSVGTPGPLSWSHTNAVAAGTVIQWNMNTTTNWSIGQCAGARPQLTYDGDQLFAYVGTISNNPSLPPPCQGDPSGATLLFGLNFANAGWNNLTGGDTKTSFIPCGLATNPFTAVHATSKENAYYNGPRTGTVEQLLHAIADTTNWVTSNTAFNPTNWPASFRVLRFSHGTVLSVW